MHPHLITALARQRRADLLRQQRFRDDRLRCRAPAIDATERPIRSVRYSLGSALVLAGTRLMAGRGASVDLAVGAPVDAALR